VRCAEEDSNLHPVSPDQALKTVGAGPASSDSCGGVGWVHGGEQIGRLGHIGCCHGRCRDKGPGPNRSCSPTWFSARHASFGGRRGQNTRGDLRCAQGFGRDAAAAFTRLRKRRRWPRVACDLGLCRCSAHASCRFAEPSGNLRATRRSSCSSSRSSLRIAKQAATTFSGGRNARSSKNDTVASRHSDVSRPGPRRCYAAERSQRPRCFRISVSSLGT
jgi:hypothetical protein